MITKIQTSHLERMAYIYLRQSTMKQVRLNVESTERQYALEKKAKSLGWSPDKIKVLDGDLGLSGTQTTARLDFQSLVADVSMNKVGAVFALEASRLSRSNTDWHRLIELCSFTGTLIIDEDGCYNPSDFNDQLLLGLKGAMSQAELHFIRARLLGGKRNKAKKGELRCPLPVGYCYDEENKVSFDANSEVFGAVELVFSLFKEKGTAYAVSHQFNKKGLKFPKRSYGGIWNGKIIWSNLTSSRVLSILKNPCYAGVYTHGRFGYKKSLNKEGKVELKTTRKPMKNWDVMIKDHHEGYITWDEYQKNQDTLSKNRTNHEGNLLPLAAREGHALLQGLMICKKCGKTITIRYKGDKKCAPWYQCKKRKSDGLSSTECFNIHADLLDEAISKRMTDVITRGEIEAAIKVYNELEKRTHKVDKQWEMRIQQAEYQTSLKQRRYEEVDPANRLVASTLEKKWNEALEDLEKIKSQYRDFQDNQSLDDLAKYRSEVKGLSKNFKELWTSPETSEKDRKRLLRLLIKDITTGESSKDRNQIIMQIRWHGGATEEVHVTRRMRAHEKWKHSPEIIKRVHDLAQTMTNTQIAELLNKEGVKTNKGNSFTKGVLSWIRYKHKISIPTRQEYELTGKEVMAKFQVSYDVMNYWIEKNIVKARQVAKGHTWWITVCPETEQRLRTWVECSTRIKKVDQSLNSLEGSAL